jgi:hypothetical protein
MLIGSGSAGEAGSHLIGRLGHATVRWAAMQATREGRASWASWVLAQ